jgi:hypothetical protein
VLNNRIRGRASAALSVIDQSGGMPGNNAFVSNDVSGFQSSVADIFVDAGATNRRASRQTIVPETPIHQ